MYCLNQLIYINLYYSSKVVFELGIGDWELAQF